MAGNEVINVSILGEFKQLTKATKGSEASLRGLNKKISGFSKAMKGSLATIGIGFSLNFVKDALTEVTKAALDDRKSQELLKTTLENVTGASADQVAAVEESIAGWQKASAVADDELRPAYDKLIRSTKDVKDANRLMDIAMDVSAGTGKDLTTVAQILGKAFNGNEKALEKLVPGISAAKDPLDELAKSFEGATEKAADNDPLKRVEIIFGDIQETLGAELLPYLDQFADWLASDEGSEFLDDVVEGLKTAVELARELFNFFEGLANSGVTKSPEAGAALGFVRKPGDTSGVTENITRNGNMGTYSLNSYNIQTKASVNGAEIIQAIKRYETQTGKKFVN